VISENDDCRMGDCRIRIIVARDLLSKESQDRIPAVATKNSISIVRTYSADTTVREVAESIHEVWDLYSSKKKEFYLWDCTVHPPKNITDWPLEQFPQLTGPKSKTLHDAGWFPSGTWMVLRPELEPSQFSDVEYEDFQYNKQRQEQETLISSGKVQFTDSSLRVQDSKPLPSQVMAAVTNRFEQDVAVDESQAYALRLLNQANERRRQRDRTAKLDERIQRLEQNSSEKNKKVSKQVRRMLVKSRATGDQRLEQKDRLYFECLLDNGIDEAMDRTFRFFSPQDTFAKVGSSFERPNRKDGHPSSVEVLVKIMFEDGEEYLRLPASMRFYEAISGKFLSGDLDTIIVRWYGDCSDATKSVLDDTSTLQTVMGDGGTPGTSSTEDESPNAPTGVVDHARSVNEEDTIMDDQLTASIMKMDTEKTKNPKKSSAAATKVRNMLMKSKATGDSKRIPKMEDRFFLEVVIVDRATQGATSNFYFLANKDPLERILHCMKNSWSSEALEFLVPTQIGNDMMYKRITDTSIQLSEAATQGILNSFDRLILRPKER